MKSVKEYFNELDLAKIEYVAISDVGNLPASIPTTIADSAIKVIVKDIKAFTRVANLVKVASKPKKINVYANRDYPSLRFEIIETEKGYFPQKFENALFVTAVKNDGGIRVPDIVRAQWVSLYQIFVHEEEVNNFHKISVLNSIRSTIEIVPTSYQIPVKGLNT